MFQEAGRYTTERMAEVWSPEFKLRRWAEVEYEAAKAQGAPEEALAEMRAAGVPTPAAVATEEARTRHDVVAFLNVWRADMGEAGRSWTHRGLTSSDIVDTANALRMKASTDVLRTSLQQLSRTIGRQAVMYKGDVRVGRTHGQAAEVTTWGWRLANFFYALDRAERRLASADWSYAKGKLSGPLGDFKRTGQAAEVDALRNLGLGAGFANTQVVMRDVYADFVFALAQIASVVEAIALEVRLSARSEVGEVAEGFGSSQRGSSAMPHKHNPIRSEQLSGLARIVRAQIEPVMEGIALHHERDISHSSVERIALPLAAGVTDYMVTTCNQLMENLRVYPARMRQNVAESPGLLSAMIKDRLVEVEGLDPTTAYDVVFYAFHEWEHGETETLADALRSQYKLMAADLPDPAPAPPDFDELVRLLDVPEDLVGDTAHVFAEIDDRVNPQLPF